MAKRKKNGSKKVVLRGRGDYVVDTPKGVQSAVSNIDSRLQKLESKSGPKTLVGQGAGLLGRAVGTLAGNADLGESAGTGLAKWFGYGDYSLSSNSLITGEAFTGLKFDKEKRGTRIIEREFIGDIVSGSLSGGATEFTNQSFIVNPGDATTFPWLHRVAQNYDQWRPNGIVFEFISTSSSFNGASQALGVVVAATDYDVMDQAYGSKVEMENADYSNSCKASDSLIHGLECAPHERADNLYYVRHGYVNPTTDSARFYDLGNFQIASKGMSTAGVVLGELWISYDITLFKKQLTDAGSTVAIASAYLTGADSVTPFGTAQDLYGTLGFRMNSTTFYFPPTVSTGIWGVFYYRTLRNSVLSLSSLTNCRVYTPPATYTPNPAYPTEYYINATSVSMMFVLVEVTGPNASFSKTEGVAIADPAMIWVFRIPPSSALSPL